MSGYKIEFKTQEENKQIQELLFQLDYEWKYHNIGKNFHKTHENICYLYAQDGCITTGFKSYDGKDHFENRSSYCKKITLSELYDLVVLSRSSDEDANYFHKETGTKYFVSSMNEYYFWSDEWIESHNINSIEQLVMIEKQQDLNLISGADALRAIADGLSVDNIEGKFSSGFSQHFISMEDKVHVFVKYLDEKLFRIKPQQLKLDIELPKPKRIETDPVTGSVGLIYDDNKIAREVAEDLKEQFGLL